MIDNKQQALAVMSGSYEHSQGAAGQRIKRQSVTNIDGTLHTIYMRYTYIDKYFEMKLN